LSAEVDLRLRRTLRAAARARRSAPLLCAGLRVTDADSENRAAARGSGCRDGRSASDIAYPGSNSIPASCG